MSEMLKTPLSDWHQTHGGRMVDFAGWSMPVQYESIVVEHQSTRSAVGLFDISHMGRLHFNGPEAVPFLDRAVTRRVTTIKPGQIRYALVTNEQGGILDDVLVYHLPLPEGGSLMAMVVNAGNRVKIVEWLKGQGGAAPEVGLEDVTLANAMVAVQGPAALTAVASLLPLDPAELSYYTGCFTTLLGHRTVISRTGYTGEDGCELIVPAEAALEVWETVLGEAEKQGGRPAGLGARDTLRLEAGMPLYGHELSEDINPFQADLAFAVHLQDHDFVGRAALVAARENAEQLRRVGISLEGRRIPREEFPVLFQGEVVGKVTSGTFSPTLERPLAMAYVRPQAAEVGTQIEIEIRGKRAQGEVVPLPFYRRPER